MISFLPSAAQNTLSTLVRRGARSCGLATLAAVGMIFLGQARATVIYNDDFNTLANGGARNASGQYSNEPNASTWWYVNTSSLSTSAVSTPAATGNFSGNWIATNFNSTAGNTNDGVVPFSTVTLNSVGDSLTVQFDFRNLTNPPSMDRNPEFGFFNGTPVTGDMTTLPTVTAGYDVQAIATTPGSDSAVIETDAAGNLFTIGATVGTTYAAGSTFDGAYTENFKFVLTKESATSTELDLYLNGSLVKTVTDTASTNFTYDEFALRARETADIDNFSITDNIASVPEPSTVSILALTAMAFVAFQSVRRKTA